MERMPYPTRRTIVVVLVISSVLLAGCSGLTGDDSSVEENDTNEAGEVNNSTDDPAGMNETTTTSEGADNTTERNQTDAPDDEGSSEMNESDPGTDASPASENDTETTTTDETNDTNETEGTEESTDETNDTNEAEETEDSTDESEGSTESTQTDSDIQTDDAEESEEYASPNDLRIDGVTHMESDADLEHDQVTVTNTNDDLARPIGGWEIVFEGTDQRVTIDEGTVLEPGETETIPLGDGEKVLNEDGGVAHVYDADGNHVGSWDHIGSPSGPPEADDGGDTGYVQVEVVDAESGEALEDAEVTLEGDGTNGEATGSTDGAGITTIRELPSGEYELTAEHEGYTSHSETIAVDESGTEMTVELEPSDSESAALWIATDGAVSPSSA